MAPHDVKEALTVSSRHVSMDAPLHKDEENTFYDIFLSDDDPSPDAELLSDSLRKEIDNSLSSLTPREADIIRLYYGLNKEPPYSLEEIGKLLNLTRERVRQIKEKAIKTFKNIPTATNRLRSYLRTIIFFTPKEINKHQVIVFFGLRKQQKCRGHNLRAPLGFWAFWEQNQKIHPN